MSEYHVPVLFDEVMESLSIKKGGMYFDGTLGGGGHSLGIMQRGGKIIATDRDDEAIAEATRRFTEEKVDAYRVVKSNFKQAKQVLDELGVASIDGALLDLGISSHQIDEPERGFSYRFDGALDMRMDGKSGITASDVVNEYDENEISKILFTYGEERFARKISAQIVKERKLGRINSTLQLVEIIKKSTPEFYHRQGHPAKKTFQALRIEVNGELDGLDKAVEDLTERLVSGGRLAVITFHSLEDRIVKNAFKLLCTDCICDKKLPVCVCNHKASAKNIGKYKATDKEREENSRANSATLRVIEKL